MTDGVSQLNDNEFACKRSQMVQVQLRERGIHGARVLDAMLHVPRHEFVLPEYLYQAYEDRPLPISEEQTISQPFIIAVSLQALELAGGERVLEIGTGSGYQTALLAALARKVYSIERHASLAAGAKEVMARLEINNVTVAVGDGSCGLPEHAPFDAIVVSAAAPSLPRSLFEQLAEGGRMVVPVGPPQAQELQLVRKSEAKPRVEILESCRFVPLVGAEGY
jgi:protein-L-isoaspartate(D-aspartate) O-methyltransferase